MNKIISRALRFSNHRMLDDAATITDAMRKMSSGDLSVRIAESLKGSRFGELASAFDVLAEKLSSESRVISSAYEAQRASEERFRSFVENANDVVFALTPDGVFSYVSPRWKDAFGYEISETVGSKFTPFVHPDDVQGCFEFLQKVMTTGEKQYGVEYRVRCKDGHFIWYKANGALIRDERNNSFTFIGIGRDISERKSAEEALRQSEEKFSAAFHASPDAITITKVIDGTCLEVNEGFTRLTGHLSEDAIGKSFLDLDIWVDPEERAMFVKRVEANGMVNNLLIRLKNKKGRQFDGQVTARTILISGTLCMIAITRDVSEHEFLQKERLKSLKLESIGILASGIAHNFNNVLTGVIGYISYAKKHLKDPDKVLPILESAEQSSYRAAGLARQLLTYSRGGNPVKKEILIDELVEESITALLTGTNVGLEIVARTHQMVKVDSQQIRQALHNIVTNAVQSMPEGGVLEVRVSAVNLTGKNRYQLPPGSYVEILVKDSGCGIKKADLENIYDPYFTTKDGGTGLGLSTAHAIIKKHNGHIDIFSDLGRGTLVTMLLPMSESQAVAPGSARAGQAKQ